MTQQLSLFTARGSTFLPSRDGARLAGLYDRCLDYALSHDWVTLRELHENCGGTEASCSARLRDMRARGWYVETKYVSRGLWKYRVSTAPAGPLPEAASRQHSPAALKDLGHLQGT